MSLFKRREQPIPEHKRCWRKVVSNSEIQEAQEYRLARCYDVCKGYDERCPYYMSIKDYNRGRGR